MDVMHLRIKEVWIWVLAALLVMWLLLSGSAHALVDPMYIGVGARPLGMGKAYVGYAEDGDALFTNPAGLGRIDCIKVTNMQANLMNDVSYLVLGGIYPIDKDQSIGLGYVGLGSSGIELRDDAGTLTGSGDYNSAVYFLSYGLKAQRLIPSLSENIYLGSNLKYFARSLTGSAAMEEGSGSGFDMDLSLLYQANPWLTLGYTQQNVLPASMGGKITYANGYSEGVSSITKLGSKVQILGDKESALNESDYYLSVGLDADLYVTQKMPSTLHFGTEFWPNEVLAIRLGLDQDPNAATSVVTNVCGGIGVRYRGLEFNYAYHPYSNLSEDATHYFSLAYVGEEWVPFNIFVDDPSDKLVTKDRTIRLTGRVEGLGRDQLKSLRAGDVTLVLNEDNTFAADLPLSYGKNLVKVEGERVDGATASDKKRVLCVKEFPDVDDVTLAHQEIEYFGTLGLVEGYPGGEFKPENTLSRVELTTLLVRVTNLDTPDVYGKVFKDMKVGHWANKYMQVAKGYYLVEGYPDGTFKPQKKINRVESSVVVTRFDNDITYPEAVLEKPFWDIKLSHWAAPHLTEAKKAEMLSFVVSDYLNGHMGVDRSQFVSMLSKTGIGDFLITRLLDFETGYETPDEKIVYIPEKTIEHQQLAGAEDDYPEIAATKKMETKKVSSTKKSNKYTAKKNNGKKTSVKKSTKKTVRKTVDMSKLRAYLRGQKGTDIVGKASNVKGISGDVYVLGNGKFLYVSGLNVNIYDASNGAWDKIDYNTVEMFVTSTSSAN